LQWPNPLEPVNGLGEALAENLERIQVNIQSSIRRLHGDDTAQPSPPSWDLSVEAFGDGQKPQQGDTVYIRTPLTRITLLSSLTTTIQLVPRFSTTASPVGRPSAPHATESPTNLSYPQQRSPHTQASVLKAINANKYAEWSDGSNGIRS
jgi:hypothetical protein